MSHKSTKALVACFASAMALTGAAVTPAYGDQGPSSKASVQDVDWIKVSAEPATDTYFDPELGMEVTTSGVKSTFVPSNVGSKQSSTSSTTAGCQRIEYLSNTGRAQGSTAPYYIYVVGNTYAEVSSGCSGSAYFSARLRDVRQFGYKPTIDDTGSLVASPGAGRVYGYLNARCVSGREYFMEGTFAPYSTPRTIHC